MVVEYAGATINFCADGSNSGARFPDGAGGLISFGTSDFVITLVIESVTLPDFNVAPIAYAIYANQGDAGTAGGARADTPNNDNTRDAWAYVANDNGTDRIVGSRALYPNLTLASPDNPSPVSFPVTLTIERSGTTITTSAVDALKAVLDLGTSAVDAADIMYPRLFFFDPDGVSVPGTSMTVSLAQLSGDSVPDVNLPAVPAGPTVAITRDGGIEEAFTSGTAEWTVTFSEAMNGVTDDDFSRVLTGDATADAATVAVAKLSGTVFAVTAENVTGSEGTIRLNFNDGTDVVTVADGTSIEGRVGPAYYIGIAMPAVGLLGLGLAAGAIAALGASAARRQKK
jgi:hypothetical protein